MRFSVLAFIPRAFLLVFFFRKFRGSKIYIYFIGETGLMLLLGTFASFVQKECLSLDFTVYRISDWMKLRCVIVE